TDEIFENNTAKNGGAIYAYESTGLVDSISCKNNFADNNGGAIYVEKYSSSLGNSSFEGNEAKGFGGAIYSNSYIDVSDTDFLNNIAQQGSAIYAKSIGIAARSRDVKISGNNGNALYTTEGNLELHAQKNKKITIDDNIHVTGEYEAGIRIDAPGTYELNGQLDLVSSYGSGFIFGNGCDGATLKLGKNAATGEYSIVVMQDFNTKSPSNVTLDLQNGKAGDVIKVPYLLSGMKDNILNVKIDYDAKNSLLDNLIIDKTVCILPEGEEDYFGDVLIDTPSVKFDLNNIVIFDDENWVDGSTRTIRYLTDNSSKVIDLTENGSYAFDDGTVYSFTVMKENKGTANVLREEKYISLEEAIADATTNGYTLRSGDYKLSDDSKGLGTISSEKTIFAINGNNNSLDGNGKDGITVATADQTLNINDVKEFKNFKTAVTNQSGIVNINNSTFIDNEIDLVNEKTTNITNSTLNGVVQNNNGTINLTDSSIKNTVTNNAELNIYGDSTIQNIIGTGTVAIGDESKEANVIFGKDNSIKQSQVTINEKGSLEIYADKLELTDGVVNNNKLTLKAQEATEEAPETINKNTITGYGTTVIDGGVINTEKSIGSKNILVNENATLKANADNVGITGTTEKVTNNGTVSLNGGTLGILIDGGKIALTGDVTSSADNLFGDITNDGKLTLTTGTLKKDIAESETGSVLIAEGQSVVNEANINQLITVDGAAYETSADRIYDKDDAIKALNGSEITLNGGTLKENRIVGE
ncbi:MAG: hypothetical protein Q4E87_07120, partial [bacterium]|nr:hypothetical protein [bacterium]